MSVPPLASMTLPPRVSCLVLTSTAASVPLMITQSASRGPPLLTNALLPSMAKRSTREGKSDQYSSSRHKPLPPCQCTTCMFGTEGGAGGGSNGGLGAMQPAPMQSLVPAPLRTKVAPLCIRTLPVVQPLESRRTTAPVPLISTSSVGPVAPLQYEELCHAPMPPAHCTDAMSHYPLAAAPTDAKPEHRGCLAGATAPGRPFAGVHCTPPLFFEYSNGRIRVTPGARVVGLVIGYIRHPSDEWYDQVHEGVQP